jgi:ABC-type transport system involved in multi-copper enzyme maturation permease subunit
MVGPSRGTQMLGPIFSAEMLRAGRRGRTHGLRWLYAFWLCLQLVYVYDATHPAYHSRAAQLSSPGGGKEDILFGRQFRDLVLSQQFLLIILVTPAFVAGAITDEKTRGTLAGLLTAYVTPTDIVLGKLAARCAQVGVLALTPLPLLAVVAHSAGATPEFLFCLVAVTALVLAGLGGVSILASVWTRQTRTAVVATYVGLAVAAWLLNAVVVAGWLPWECKGYFDPLRPLTLTLDRIDPAEAFRRLGQTALAWGGLGLVTTTVAVAQLRPAYLRQLGAKGWRPGGRLTGRPLTGRPRPVRDVIAWKECYVGRRIPAWLGLPATAVLAAAVTSYALSGGIMNKVFFLSTLITLGSYALLMMTLIVGVRCSGAITGERERQTWDGLMTSPLSPRELVRGKLRGILRATSPYLLAIWLGVAVAVALLDEQGGGRYLILGLGVGGLVLAYARRWVRWVAVGFLVWAAGVSGPEVAAVVCLLFGVTYLAMFFLGAVGLYCSARSDSSWRSLVATVAIGYVGGSIAFCVGIPIGCMGSVILMVFLEVVQTLFGAFGGWAENTPSSAGPGPMFQTLWPMSIAIGAGFLFWLVGQSFLTAAENVVRRRDRVPDWLIVEEQLPARRRPSRRVRR